MRIVGEWQLNDDGITRPVLNGKVRAADGSLYATEFLIDTGADRSVLAAALANSLGLPANPEVGIALQGVGGISGSVFLTTMVELMADDGTPARIHGQFAAFTDPTAADMSILGRDVLDHFDVIVSRRRDAILLLAGQHQYVVT
jgi:hypothetical protein